MSVSRPLCGCSACPVPRTRLPNQKSRQEKKIFWLDGMLYQSKPISSGKKKTRTKTQMTVARSKMRLGVESLQDEGLDQCSLHTDDDRRRTATRRG